MKKALILTFVFALITFAKAWSQNDKTQPTAKPTAPAKDKTEQMKKAEEKSDGAAYSGKGKGGEKDMVEKDKKDKTKKAKKAKKAKKDKKTKKAKKVKQGEQPESGDKEQPDEQPKPQTEPAPKPTPEAKPMPKTKPQTEPAPKPTPTPDVKKPAKTKENGGNKK